MRIRNRRRIRGLQAARASHAVPAGARLQQGATYLDLTDPVRAEFKATGDLVAPPNRAYVPKDKVPYQIWNRLTGKADENPERG